jgi:phosphatidylserine/phosphatidylglycerophosphate/cardiolipin synthase-like enzyme
MNTAEITVPDARVSAVPDEQYGPVCRDLIRAARRRCLCSVFIVDTWPWRDNDLVIDALLIDLASTAWRGADVRLLIGGSRSNLQLAEVAAAARARARELGIACRWLTSVPGRRGSHVKLVIADDDVLTGSHNWSSGAFEGQTQDSVHVRSAALAAYLADTFEQQWRRTPAEAAHV